MGDHILNCNFKWDGYFYLKKFVDLDEIYSNIPTKFENDTIDHCF